ncbi:LysR substrate-binding domain-containing protein [Hoeflea sp.]|uniref:LysR substrate-binding domain-containing protein n=1 Tax=Hoeflea sp. TaxID=1940281 RepID=UPI003BAE69A2
MKRGRLPLTALRSFEAAGRLESVTLAAEELFVSQAAVSRQIRDLETLLGCSLFARHYRQIRLTAEGSELLAVLTGAFDAISDGLDGLSDRGEGGEVRLSVEPSFASGWLVGALRNFRAVHPNIDVVIESSSRLTEFRSKDAELAIRFSLRHRHWPRTQARWLYDVEMAPFASPGLFEAEGLPSDALELGRHDLLHEDTRSVWEKWFQEAGAAPDSVRRGPVLADGGLVRQAALGGQGVALIDTRMVTDDVENGSLVRVSDRSIGFGAYFLVARDFSRLSRPGQLFAQWIEDAFSGGVRAVSVPATAS